MRRRGTRRKFLAAERRLSVRPSSPGLPLGGGQKISPRSECYAFQNVTIEIEYGIEVTNEPTQAELWKTNGYCG